MRERGINSLAVVFIVVMLLPALYIGSYAALLSPKPRLGMCSDGICRKQRRPAYRYGGEKAKQVFAPIYAADRQVRRAYWEEDLR
jgi:hypothetical protein